jgi:hypothetical protein
MAKASPVLLARTLSKHYISPNLTITDIKEADLAIISGVET